MSSASGRDFPYGTLVVNLSGAVVLGLLTGLALGHDAALLAGTAAVGSYTTFSTWMLETQRLTEERQYRRAVANIVGQPGPRGGGRRARPADRRRPVNGGPVSGDARQAHQLLRRAPADRGRRVRRRRAARPVRAARGRHQRPAARRRGVRRQAASAHRQVADPVGGPAADRGRGRHPATDRAAGRADRAAHRDRAGHDWSGHACWRRPGDGDIGGAARATCTRRPSSPSTSAARSGCTGCPPSWPSATCCTAAASRAPPRCSAWTAPCTAGASGRPSSAATPATPMMVIAVGSGRADRPGAARARRAAPPARC